MNKPICPRFYDLLIPFSQNRPLAMTTLSVIARRERSEGRGNPSCPEGRVRRVWFVYWFTVDRHGLRPRDDNTLFATDESAAVHHASVIARRERSEGRGNPSCPEGPVRGMRFAYRFTVDRHGLRPRDDKGGLGSGWLTLDQIGAFT